MNRVYLVQMNILFNQKEENFKTVSRLLENVSVEPGSLILLPEMFATGFFPENPKNAAEKFYNKDLGKTARFLFDLALEKEAVIQGSGIAKTERGVQNRVSVYGPRWDYEIASYHKMKLFFEEKEHFIPGLSPTFYTWRHWKVSPFLCYDLRFPELFRNAMIMGCDILSVAANWPRRRQEHFRTLLRARAIENQSYVLGINRTGNGPHEDYAGGSIIIGPSGEILAEAGEEECVVSFELNRESLYNERRKFPVLDDYYFNNGFRSPV
ncbi:MAG: nitrilase [Fibrobacter sp.]|jgi:predicted amidohydrolase|nr:nitrilase [Fibrobacter sp.]